MKKFEFSKNGGFYYTNQFVFSKAYLDLSKSATILLHCLINEGGWHTEKKKKRNYRVYHTYDVSFTEIHFKRFYTASSTFQNARDQLIKNGLIKIIKRGGKFRGDLNVYRLLCVPTITPVKERWRNYPEQNWEDEIPKYPKQLIGLKTRFKKKKKTNSTLKGPTLLSEILPKELDPLKKERV